MTKASDLFVQCLEEEGCEYVFGVPGEENLDMLDSLSRSTKIKLILTRHEQGAGFMAATYGRHTGKTGVCMATLGPGATNFVTAAAYAQLGGMPILMVTGPEADQEIQAGPLPDPGRGRMMGPITKLRTSSPRPTTSRAGCARPIASPRRKSPARRTSSFPEDIADEQTDSPPIPRSVVAPPDRRGESRSRRGEADRGGPIARAGAGAGRQPQDDQPLAAAVHREDRHPRSSPPNSARA
jgi:acetolactate synthase-1/2/3 large subunit